MLEQCLSGANMATSVIQKANARLKFLYRKRKFLNLTAKMLLVMSLTQCHFDYACSFWYPGLPKVLKNKLQVTQNKIIRFVLNMDSKAHVGSEVFKSLGWLSVSKRVDQIILNHVFKVKSGQSPDYMVEQIIPASSIYSYGNRFRETGCFSIPKVKCFGKKSFGYNWCVLWNELPGDIRNLQRYPNFKVAVKKFLLSKIDW